MFLENRDLHVTISWSIRTLGNWNFETAGHSCVKFYHDNYGDIVQSNMVYITSNVSVSAPITAFWQYPSQPLMKNLHFSSSELHFTYSFIQGVALRTGSLDNAILEF